MVTALVSHVITAWLSLQSFARRAFTTSHPLVNACPRQMTKLLPARLARDGGFRPAGANGRIAA
jgi:hypothetical protein